MPLLWLAVDGKGRAGKSGCREQSHFVIRLGEQQDAASGTVRRGVGRVGLLALHGQDMVQVFQDESLGELIQHALAEVVLHTRFLKFAANSGLS